MARRRPCPFGDYYDSECDGLTVADLDGSDDAASWLVPGHVLTRDEVAYLRALRLP